MRHCPRFGFVLGLGLAGLCVSIPAQSSCRNTPPEGPSRSVDDLVAEIQSRQLRYVFVGEHHAVGPVKRFTVELVNALVSSGSEVGLYVEGFRTDCPFGDETCWSLARSFNADAFRRLARESAAAVYPIDPPERDRRADRMATVIADGKETVRVVLVGKSHVIHAWDPDAELWVYGGGLRYPNPGDLAEAFPPEQTLTIGLETVALNGSPYALYPSGCGLDYVVTTPASADYWGTGRPAAGDDGPKPPPQSDHGASGMS